MGELNLIQIARELLAIHEEFPYHLKNYNDNSIRDFVMETFTQLWGNTSGGFESIGGAAMTIQRTYVFIPTVNDEDCQVYFGGAYTYSVPYSKEFEDDVKAHNVAGKYHKGKYLKGDK
jgi:hypothetical protein